MTSVHAAFPALSTGQLVMRPYRRTVTGNNILVVGDAISGTLDGGSEVTITTDIPEDAVAWMFIERIDGVDHARPAVLVPTAGALEYAALVDVDPVTLTAATPDPLWETALAALIARVDALEELGGGFVVGWSGILEKPLLYTASETDLALAGTASSGALTSEVGTREDLGDQVDALNPNANVAWVESEAAADALPADTLVIILDPL